MHEPTTKPYLDSVRGVADVETVIEWARYLGTTFGTGGALNALRYYQRLNWITPEVRADLERHLGGLSIEEIHTKKYDEPGTLDEPLESLSGTPFGTHARSLSYIAAIAGDDLTSDLLRNRMAERHAGTEVPSAEIFVADGGEDR
ncbi:FlaD/FlaE family flagellar protein [Natronomonas sp. EA1]|uniref:FlaD/FlaE family flagellar protein n=1 Tax=Natronomonas sp. EA1 TaxID=3421655 RepID=UPI003EB9CF5A